MYFGTKIGRFLFNANRVIEVILDRLIPERLIFPYIFVESNFCITLFKHSGERSTCVFLVVDFYEVSKSRTDGLGPRSSQICWQHLADLRFTYPLLHQYLVVMSG